MLNINEQNKTPTIPPRKNPNNEPELASEDQDEQNHSINRHDIIGAEYTTTGRQNTMQACSVMNRVEPRHTIRGYSLWWICSLIPQGGRPFVKDDSLVALIKPFNAIFLSSYSVFSYPLMLRSPSMAWLYISCRYPRETHPTPE